MLNAIKLFISYIIFGLFIHKFSYTLYDYIQCSNIIQLGNPICIGILRIIQTINISFMSLMFFMLNNIFNDLSNNILIRRI